MSIFEKLYKGKIHPMENCVPQTDEYKKAMHELSAASEHLENALDEKQKELFQNYQIARADVETLIQIEVYRQGTQFGWELTKELKAEKKTKNDRLLGITDE